MHKRDIAGLRNDLVKNSWNLSRIYPAKRLEHQADDISRTEERCRKQRERVAAPRDLGVTGLSRIIQGYLSPAGATYHRGFYTKGKRKGGHWERIGGMAGTFLKERIPHASDTAARGGRRDSCRFAIIHLYALAAAL